MLTPAPPFLAKESAEFLKLLVDRGRHHLGILRMQNAFSRGNIKKFSAICAFKTSSDETSNMLSITVCTLVGDRMPTGHRSKTPSFRAHRHRTLSNISSPNLRTCMKPTKRSSLH